MSATEREAGKHWVFQTLLDLRKTANIDVEAEWGPAWEDAPPRFRRGKPKPNTTALLILTLGQRRKIVWIPEEELLECGTGRSCDKVQKRLKAAVEYLRAAPPKPKRAA